MFQKRIQEFLLVLSISHGISQFAARHRIQSFKPPPISLKQRFCLYLTRCFAYHITHFEKFLLQSKELITIVIAPSRLGSLFRCPLWHRLTPIAPHMTPTSAADHAVHLVAGHDHHFGHKNQGSPELLQAKCAELGLGCDIIPVVTIGGITVSSTYIRRLVGLGQVERAMEYLGHPHILTQTVRHGRRIGHTIGIPTVNLVPPPHVLVPGNGVYTARVCLADGSSYAAVTNVGTRPTVNNGNDLTVESWMLDFDGDLYGQTIRVEFYQHLRDEIRFDSLDELKAQIESDALKVRAYFAAHN